MKKTLFTALAAAACCLGAHAQITPQTKLAAGRYLPPQVARSLPDLHRTFAAGAPAAAQHSRWDSIASSWQYDSDYAYLYDAQGREINVTITPLAAGRNRTRLLYTYTPSNGLLSAYEQQEERNGVWVPLYINNISYDNYGNETEMRITERDSLTGTMQFTFGLRHFYTYATSGNILEDETLMYYNGSWTKNIKRTFTYDTSGLTSEELVEAWMGSSYEAIQKNVAFVWSTGATLQPVSFMQQTKQNGVWQDHFSFTFNYQNKNSELLVREKTGTNWTNYYTLHYLYDQQDNLTDYKYETWSGNQWDTFEWYKYLLSYDSNSHLTEQITQIWSRYHAMLQNTERFAYATVTGAPDLAETATLQLYPNPVQHTLQLQTADAASRPVQVAIYTLDGRLAARKVFAATGASTYSLELDHLPAGCYVASIRTASGQLIRQKLVKQ